MASSFLSWSLTWTCGRTRSSTTRHATASIQVKHNRATFPHFAATSNLVITKPLSFYAATNHRVYTVTNETILMSDDPNLWSYEARSRINPQTELPFIDGNYAIIERFHEFFFPKKYAFSDDLYMFSRYLGYSMVIKSAAFIPCILGFLTFITSIAVYGRIAKVTSTNAADKTTELWKTHTQITK